MVDEAGRPDKPGPFEAWRESTRRGSPRRLVASLAVVALIGAILLWLAWV